MKLPRLCLASIILLAGHFSYANPLSAKAPLCSRIFLKQYFRTSGTEIVVSWQAQHSEKDYDSQLSKIDAILGTLKKPFIKKIIIVDAPDHNSFDPVNRELFASWKLKKQSNRMNHHSPTDLSILDHEYGHAVLDENLRLISPSYSRIMNEYHAAEEKHKKTLDFFDLEMIHPYHRTILMLHEFFADITAVTISKDPTTVYESLPRTESSFDLMMRNFRNNSHLMIEKWSRLPAEKLDIYASLYPARAKFWELVKDRIHTKSYQEKILPAMSQIIANEVEKIGRLSYNDLTYDLRRTVDTINYNLDLAMTESLP